MLFLSKPQSTHMHIAYEFIDLHRSCNAVFEILGVVGYDDMTPSIFGGLETGWGPQIFLSDWCMIHHLWYNSLIKNLNLWWWGWRRKVSAMSTFIFYKCTLLGFGFGFGSGFSYQKQRLKYELSMQSSLISSSCCTASILDWFSLKSPGFLKKWKIKSVVELKKVLQWNQAVKLCLVLSGSFIFAHDVLTADSLLSPTLLEWLRWMLLMLGNTISK